jgi:hypothetical protein
MVPPLVFLAACADDAGDGTGSSVPTTAWGPGSQLSVRVLAVEEAETFLAFHDPESGADCTPGEILTLGAAVDCIDETGAVLASGQMVPSPRTAGIDAWTLLFDDGAHVVRYGWSTQYERPLSPAGSWSPALWVSPALLEQVYSDDDCATPVVAAPSSGPIDAGWIQLSDGRFSVPSDLGSVYDKDILATCVTMYTPGGYWLAGPIWAPIPAPVLELGEGRVLERWNVAGAAEDALTVLPADPPFYDTAFEAPCTPDAVAGYCVPDAASATIAYADATCQGGEVAVFASGRSRVQAMVTSEDGASRSEEWIEVGPPWDGGPLYQGVFDYSDPCQPVAATEGWNRIGARVPDSAFAAVEERLIE